eukprot:6191216-Pleurochrysis_carterae.AAC.3
MTSPGAVGCGAEHAPYKRNINTQSMYMLIWKPHDREKATSHKHAVAVSRTRLRPCENLKAPISAASVMCHLHLCSPPRACSSQHHGHKYAHITILSMQVTIYV